MEPSQGKTDCTYLGGETEGDGTLVGVLLGDHTYLGGETGGDGTLVGVLLGDDIAEVPFVALLELLELSF